MTAVRTERTLVKSRAMTRPRDGDEHVLLGTLSLPILKDVSQTGKQQPITSPGGGLVIARRPAAFTPREGGCLSVRFGLRAVTQQFRLVILAT